MRRHRRCLNAGPAPHAVKDRRHSGAAGLANAPPLEFPRPPDQSPGQSDAPSWTVTTLAAAGVRMP
jgi:hypothetical protein